MKDTVTELTELQGIGPKISKEIMSRGFVYSEDLIATSPEHVIKVLDPVDGLNSNNLYSNFIPQARMLRIQGMTGQHAEGLAKSGYRTFRQLLSEPARTIVNALEERAAEGIIDHAPSEDTVINYQLSAAQLVECGLIYFTVIDEEKNRIEGVEIKISGQDPMVPAPIKRYTDRQGIFCFDGLVYGKHVFVISKEGYKKQILTIPINQDRNPLKLLIILEHGQHEPKVIDEFAGGYIDIKSTDIISTKDVSHEDLPTLPPANVLEIKDNEAVLLSLWRKKVDEEIIAFIFEYPLNDLPADIQTGTILSPDENGKYQKSRFTLDSFRAVTRSEWIKARIQARRA